MEYWGSMASVKRDPRTRYWIACYRLPDGTRRQRSTKTTAKSAALQIALAAERASRKRMTADAARKLLSDVLLSIDEDVSEMVIETLDGFLVRWMARKRKEVGQGTADRYLQILADFCEFAGVSAKQAPLANISSVLLARYRDAVAERYAPSTANLYFKILRNVFSDAAREGVIDKDPTTRIKSLKSPRGAPSTPARRAMSAKEIKAVIAATKAASEWRGMILAGLYTGQRLGDIALMKATDITNGWWRFSARKTGSPMTIPLARPFADWLKKYASKSEFVFPDAAARVTAASGKVGTLSNQFHVILSQAGLVVHRSHAGTKDGRAAKRETGSLSFHCLRHTTNTLLKTSGVQESVAMAILGHESRAVSRVYTHLPESVLENAIKTLKI